MSDYDYFFPGLTENTGDIPGGLTFTTARPYCGNCYHFPLRFYHGSLWSHGRIRSEPAPEKPDASHS